MCPRAHTISIGVSYIMCRKAEVSAVWARPSLTKGDAQMLNPSSNPERSPQRKGSPPEVGALSFGGDTQI